MKQLFALTTILLVLCDAILGQSLEIKHDLPLDYFVQQPTLNSTAPPLIILLHGRGGNAANMFGLRDSFPNNYLIVSVQAPHQISASTYQWFDGFMRKGELIPDQKQLDSTRQLLTEFISAVVGKYKANSARVYLVGFSQGARMCYEVGLTAPEKLNGIGVLSGMMYDSLKPLIKMTAALKQLKIFIGHGTEDERIPFIYAHTASEYLKSIGLNPEFHSYSMHHQIIADELNDLKVWLNK
jgi:phospholipase/carboxylesterase